MVAQRLTLCLARGGSSDYTVELEAALWERRRHHQKTGGGTRALLVLIHALDEVVLEPPLRCASNRCRTKASDGPVLEGEAEVVKLPQDRSKRT